MKNIYKPLSHEIKMKKELNLVKLQKFWDTELKKLFPKESLNFLVKTPNGKVRYINLDNAATTTPFKSVIENILKELNSYGSVHRGAGEKSKISTDKFEETRETIKKFVDAKKSDYVAFESNTTVGMNKLAYMFARIKGKVLVADIEHSASLLPWIIQEGRRKINAQISLKNALAGETDYLNKKILQEGNKKVIKYKTNNNFAFDINDIEKIFKKQSTKKESERIKVLVVTGASNVTGYHPPIKNLSKMAHKYGALVVVDACQFLQHEKINMQKEGIDFVVFSGHKMYAPFGSGAVVGKKVVFDDFWPRDIGGGNFPYITGKGEVLRYKSNQAHDPGTPNFVGARALHYSIKQLESIGVKNISNYEHALVEYVFEELKKINNVKMYVNRNPDGSFDRSLITFNIYGMPHQLVAEILNHEYGMGVRAGAYCVYEFSRRIQNISSKQDEKITSEVKKGKLANIPGSVRASFSIFNSPFDAKKFIKAISEISKKGFDYYVKKYKKNSLTGEWEFKK